MEIADLVSPGVDWSVEAEVVICYPPGEPLLWRDPGRVSGALCLNGTRVPIDVPLGALAEGAPLRRSLRIGRLRPQTSWRGYCSSVP
jgi:hypothetical protein